MHKVPYIIRCAIRTPDGTVLETAHRHDYQTHIDTSNSEFYFLDGGHGYYYRTSINKEPAELLMVTTDDPFEVQRVVPFWRSYGKDGEYYPQGIRLSLQDMQTDHINNILCTQYHIRGTDVERMFKNELDYRSNLNYHNKLQYSINTTASYSIKVV